MLLVSDIHFGANAPSHVKRFMTDALEPASNPEKLIVIAGDMTQRAKPGEFRQAERFISELIESGIRILLTPGNHDFGDWMGEYLVTNRAARSRYRNLVEPVFSQKGVLATDDFDFIMKADRNIFVVLRSTHRGYAHKFGIIGTNRIRARQIEWALSELSSIDREGCLLHLVTHRSLWRESGDRHSGIHRRRRLEEQLLSLYRFHSIIHGHNHRFVFAYTSTPELSIPVIRMSLPTISMRSRKFQKGYVRWTCPYDGLPEFIKL